MTTHSASSMAPVPPVPLPSTLGDAALAYARARLPVFPLRPCEKVPLVKGGFHAATTDVRQVVAWWRRWPDANIGIPTGPVSGWIALDVDPRNGGWTSLEALRDLAARVRVDIHETCCQRSGGGGIHLLFAFREQLASPRKHAGMLRGYAGIDLKGLGGYLVVAPSRHPGGGQYQWLRTAPLTRFPDLLLSLARTPSLVSPVAEAIERRHNSGHDPGALLEMALAHAHEGTRHRSALVLACRLVEAGVPPGEAERLLCRYARLVPAGSHPFSEQEALACLAWARRQGVAPHAFPLHSGSLSQTSPSDIA